MPRHGITMGEQGFTRPDAELRQSGDRTPAMLEEERVSFVHRAAPEAGQHGLRTGEWPHEATRTAWRRLGVVLGLALIMVICFALAPAMADTYQLLADLLYPLEP